MPFNLFGEKIDEKAETKPPQKPIRVRLVKRGQKVVTLVLHVGGSEEALNELASAIKRKWGCGGAVKAGEIELQGDRVAQVSEWLRAQGLKVGVKGG